jgi:hypothetical protein
LLSLVVAAVHAAALLALVKVMCITLQEAVYTLHFICSYCYVVISIIEFVYLHGD